MIFNFKDIIGKVRTGDWFKKERINSPDENMKTVVKDSNVNGDLVGRDKNEFNNGNTPQISNIEKKVLKVLYLKHQRDNSQPREKHDEVFRILEIKEGNWVAPLNDSKYLKIDGDSVVMNADGLRYMDNLDPADLTKIVLPEEQRRRDDAMEQQRRRIEENRRNRGMDSTL